MRMPAKWKRLFVLTLLAAMTSASIVTYTIAAETKTPNGAEAGKTDSEQDAKRENSAESARGSEPGTIVEPSQTKDAKAGGGADGKTVTGRSGQTASNSYRSLFPDDDAFRLASENAYLGLYVDPKTGHFLVKDKRSGQEWRSFPDANGWNDKDNTNTWKKHMQSPVFIKYVEFNVRKDQIKETNVKDQKAAIERFEITDSGFRLTFDMPDIGFAIPIEVSLKDDSVETKIIEEGFKDGKSSEEMAEYESRTKKKDKNARIAALRLYPFLGAYTSDREDGYLLIPDGPGTLIQFRKDRPPNNNFYFEGVYGEDYAFSNNNQSLSIRQPVRMPVFGIKAGGQGLLAVIRDGAEYANVLAAPSKSMNQYNWATAEFTYRQRFFQPTDKRKQNGFQTFNKELAHGDRSIRYYFLDAGSPDYVGMAARYRQVLTEEDGLKRATPDDGSIRLPIYLLGADSKKGFLWDSYEALTTTSEAEEIVNELTAIGVKKMAVTYAGWQKGGISDFGGHFPVDKGIGGNEGMRHFIEYAHVKGHDVTLDASSYTFNNTGRDGFRSSRDGLQDLGSVVIKYGGRNETSKTLVSPRFMEKVLRRDLDKFKPLGADGLTFGEGLGSLLNSDFNERHKATREEVKGIQQQLFDQAVQTLGSVRAESANAYAWKYVDALDGLPIENSFDLFVDETVPFMQIALHGLIPYSSTFANTADNYTTYLLKNLEYGSIPSFMLTYAASQDLIGTRSLYNYYSTHYKDWSEEIAKQYGRFNEALGDVQDRMIVGHRSLAAGVYETTYDNGKRIVVNYNESPYHGSGYEVEARDFAVVHGGRS